MPSQIPRPLCHHFDTCAAGVEDSSSSSSSSSSDTAPNKPDDKQHAEQPGHHQRSESRYRPAMPPRMLYIQMEFCPRTLRDALDQGGLSEEQAWQVSRPHLIF